MLEQIEKLLNQIYQESEILDIIKEEFLVNKSLEQIKIELKEFMLDIKKDNEEYLLDKNISKEERLFFTRDVELRQTLIDLLESK